MLLSIVVPVYNAKKYLDESLKSIEVCSSNDIEVILVDDGSRDSSAKICDDWQKKDSRFHAYHIPNGGVSNARNYGMKQCSGNRIMFLDADDYI
ncbi:MAG: glycosyltransferase family A protein, partial [Agathobacter sp.]|nr:glycosyltransferase family A protein [Agathobacter sp.]